MMLSGFSSGEAETEGRAALQNGHGTPRGDANGKCKPHKPLEIHVSSTRASREASSSVSSRSSYRSIAKQSSWMSVRRSRGFSMSDTPDPGLDAAEATNGPKK